MTDTEKIEDWVPVKGFKNYYSISSSGEVRREKSYRCTNKGRILKPTWNPRYLVITLSAKGKLRRCFIHTLVAENFIGKRPKNHVVNHKDTNRSNNHYSNLEYLTPKQNSIHAYINGCYRINRNSFNGRLMRIPTLLTKGKQ